MFCYTMKLKMPGGEWCLFFLMTGISGLQSVVSPPDELQIFSAVLQSSESRPLTGNYVLKSSAGDVCIRVTMGVEYIVVEEKRSWYFNLDPTRVRTHGVCGPEESVLTLSLPDGAASLQLTFTKDDNVFWVSGLAAHLSSQPVCKSCCNMTYSFELSQQKLFTAAVGRSFRCQSGELISPSSELKVKLLPVQLQAFFSGSGGSYGEEVECWADFNRRMTPIVLGAIAVGFALIALTTFLLVKERRRPGYDQF